MDNLSLFFLVFGLNNKSQILDWLMIFGAEYVIYFTLILIFITAFRSTFKERRAFVLAIVSIPLVIVLIKIIHLFIFQPRPFENLDIIPLIKGEADASFPSRHASLMTAISFPYLFYKSKWALLFLFLMLWVGIARVYVGVHYPIDILGGFITGLVSFLLTRQIIKILRTKILG